MSPTANIDLRKVGPANYRQVSEAITALGQPLPAELESDLVRMIATESETNLRRSFAAFIAAKLKIDAALPVIAGLLHQSWIDPMEIPAYNRADPATAIAMYGPVARPLLEDILRKTDRPEIITLATILIFNVTRDKSEAEKSMLAAKAARPGSDAQLFEPVMTGIKDWKE